MSRLPAALVALALAGCTWLAAARLAVARERPYDIPVIPRSQALRWLSLGHPSLAADLFWLRAVQYIGEPAANRRGWEKLLPVLDLVTDLDPGHGYAYQVGGVILGSVGRVPESNAILEKGIRAVPDRYILPYLRAFNAFYYDDDWAEAGRWAEIAARTPGAPPHVRQNVIAYYVKGQRSEAALAFLAQARQEVHDEDSRKAIDEQVKQVRFEQAAAAVDGAVARYRAERGVGPLYLGRLVSEGYLPALPADPFGGAWVLGEDGRVRSSAHGFRFKPPTQPWEKVQEPGVKNRQ